MECFKCHKLFKLKTDLQRHLERKIKCDRILECEKCKKVFKTKQNLNSHLNNKKSCDGIPLEAEIEILKLKNKVLEYEKEIINLKQISHTNNINNGIINNGTINNINIFGSESIEHITKKILEQEILKIVQKDYECYNKVLEFQGVRYIGTSFIKMVDIHLLMTKLIYFTKKKNRTVKKKNNKYFINKEDGWEETNLEQMNIKILTKHQEVLVQCQSVFIENEAFRKVLEFYFDNDENKLIVEVGKIEIFISDKRLKLLNQTLDYELENMDKLDTTEINHYDNVVKK